VLPVKFSNIACGERYTLTDLVDSINSLLGKKIEPIFNETRPGDVKHSLAGIEKSKKPFLVLKS